MYGRGHAQGTRTQTARQSTWYADIEAANIRAAEDAERTLVTALAQQVGNAIVAMPEAAERIRKAAQMVQARDVYPLTSGNFLVGSQSGTDAYLVVRQQGWSCQCGDYRGRKHTCKHILSAMITVRMGAAYTPRYT